MHVHVLGWVLVASLTGQSLGEIAKKERERREKNRAAGVEAVAFTSSGGPISQETRDADPVEPSSSSGSESPPADETSDETVAAPSPLDEERERGSILEPRMAEIAAMADRVDRLYERWVNECQGRYLIGETPPGVGIPSQGSQTVHVQAGRDWFIVLEAPSAFTNPVTTGRGGNFVLVEPPQCTSLREDLVASATRVQQAMLALIDLARRERILPGVVRELREKYRLEWAGWHR